MREIGGEEALNIGLKDLRNRMTDMEVGAPTNSVQELLLATRVSACAAVSVTGEGGGVTKDV